MDSFEIDSMFMSTFFFSGGTLNKVNSVIIRITTVYAIYLSIAIPNVYAIYIYIYIAYSIPSAFLHCEGLLLERFTIFYCFQVSICDNHSFVC